MHVDQGVDVVTTKRGDDLGHLVEVPSRHRRIPHVRVMTDAGRAHSRLIGPAYSRFDPLPQDPESHHVESEACDADGIVIVEGVDLPGGYRHPVGGQLVDSIDTVQLDGPAKVIGHVLAAGGVQGSAEIGVRREVSEPGQADGSLGARLSHRGRGGIRGA